MPSVGRAVVSSLLACFVCFALACGGGHATKLNAAPATPAAVGEIKASRGDNGNTELSVEVEHLAPPENVASGAKVYVVWAKPHSQDPAQNLGALAVGDDRKGKLETKTVFKEFDLLVTPEATPTSAQPTSAPVMKASVVAQ